MTVSSLSLGLLGFVLLIANLLGVSLKPDSLDLLRFIAILAWINFLIVLNWLISIFLLPTSGRSKNNLSAFGVLPSLGIVTIAYSLASIATLVWFLRLANYGELSSAHWNIQYLLLGIFGTLFFLVLISAKTAELPEIRNDILEKDELIALLEEVKINLTTKQTLDKEIFSLLTSVQDVIKYSIPHLGVLKDIELYRSIGFRVSELQLLSKHEMVDTEKVRLLLHDGRRCK